VKTRLVFSDLDGTLTHGVELGPVFFDSISLLEKQNIPLVIVTGRSKSWAHFLLTHVPYLKHIISEGGGNLSFRDEEGALHDKLLVDANEPMRLIEATNKLYDAFEDLELSADSFGRETDRAIELGWLKSDPSREKQIKEFFDKENVSWSESSVHLNYWCGDISKYTAVSYFLKAHTDCSEDECLYFGDALNDESMFKHFPLSVGVSNIKDVLDKLKHKPSVILEGSENEGPYGVFNYLSTHLK
jgi:HAD superfamily hydrolase (TIGR01484 family)